MEVVEEVEEEVAVVAVVLENVTVSFATVVALTSFRDSIASPVLAAAAVVPVAVHKKVEEVEEAR